MLFGLWEIIATSLVAVVVGVVGKGTIGKYFERKDEHKRTMSAHLIDEVRAHGETKAQVAALESRVAELENYNDAMTNRWQQERSVWDMERESLSARITVLEGLLLRSKAHISDD